jgi:hypothetical protein
MSQVNVERVHRTIDAINRRELDAYLAYAEDIVWDLSNSRRTALDEQGDKPVDQ